VKHASDEALDKLDQVLRELREIEGLKEKKRGVFYRGSKAFAHFHEDPTGFYVDVRLQDDFERFRVQTAKEKSAFISRVRRAV
jgi:hypothetical protein